MQAWASRVGAAGWSTVRAAGPASLLVLGPAALLTGGLWLRGVAFVVAYGASFAIGTGAMALWRPQRLALRSQSVVAERSQGQPWLDAVGSAGLVVFALAWMAFLPMDALKWRMLGAPPPKLQAIGAVVCLGGLALFQAAVWENAFATPNLQDQTRRGQRVVDTGVYAWVRHPIYSANLMWTGGAALWLGTWAGFAAVGVLAAATVGRIRMEEAHLRRALPGYDAYMRRVRGRLVPYVL